MNTQKTLGVVLMAVGIAVFAFGLNASNSLADQWSHFAQGQYTDSTMWFILGGAATALVGLAMVLFMGRRISN